MADEVVNIEGVLYVSMAECEKVRMRAIGAETKVTWLTEDCAQQAQTIYDQQCAIHTLKNAVAQLTKKLVTLHAQNLIDFAEYEPELWEIFKHENRELLDQLHAAILVPR